MEKAKVNITDLLAKCGDGYLDERGPDDAPETDVLIDGNYDLKKFARLVCEAFSGTPPEHP